jgi:hypothetical protein
MNMSSRALRAPFLLLALCLCWTPSFAGKNVRSIDDVLHTAKRRDLVLVAGTVKRSFDLDNVLLTDEHGEIAVSFVGVRQDVRPGDRIAVAGRFDGRVGYRSNYGLLNAVAWAPLDDPKSDALRDKYGVTAASATASPSPTDSSAVVSSSGPVSGPASNVESRLRTLDDLKSKNLVTPDEYQEQRKRILSQL